MTQEALKLALEKIATVNAMDYEYQAWAREALREHAMREVQRLGQEIEQEPEYAWPTVADYERDVGFQTNEAFRMAWGMARTTNKMLGHPSQPQRTWVGLTDDEENEYTYLGPDMHWVIQEIAAKLKERNT
jgi:hypothetical protein